MFENKLLRKIFGDTRDEITVEWRKLRNAELYALYKYSSLNIIKNLKSMGGSPGDVGEVTPEGLEKEH